MNDIVAISFRVGKDYIDDIAIGSLSTTALLCDNLNAHKHFLYFN